MRIFEEVPKNTRIVALLEPASSTLATATSFYLPLLMKGNGLGELEIGWLSTIGLFLGCIMQMIAVFFVNRLGRRRSLLYFSLLCWSVPLLLWSFATSFIGFFAAALFQSTARITTVAHYCFLTEDVPEGKKQSVFSFLSLASSVGGLLTALLTPIIASMGLVTAARGLCIVSFLCMTAMFLVRYRLTTETGPGLIIAESRAKRIAVGKQKALMEYISVCRTFTTNQQNRQHLVIFMIMTFIGSMGFIHVLYLEKTLLLSTETIALIPAVTALIGVILYVVHQRIAHRLSLKERGMLSAALCITASSYIILCIAPSGQTLCVLLFYLFNSVGSYLYNVSINPLLNNGMAELSKAETYSAIQLLAIFVSVPSGVVTGFLFQMHPLFPFLFILLLLLFCCYILFRHHKRQPH